jgi:lactonase
MNRSLLGKSLVIAGVALATGLMWTGVGQGSAPSSQPTAANDRSPVSTAQLFTKVNGADPGVFGTSLEGAAFDAKGQFYFVDTTAPAGQPKLMSLDLATRKVSDLYTDQNSMLNCVGFGPDGTMYLCDLKGRIVKFDPAKQQLTNVLTKIGKSAIVPDDMTIDRSGDMYIADYQGTPTAPDGRILLREPNGTVVVALSGLAHPNGIVFTPDQQSLWVDEDLSGKLDHVAQQLSSPAATTTTPTVHTASYLNLGANAYSDSLTTDGQGNVYMAVYGANEVLEFNSDGRQIGRVVFPKTVPNVTHVAIEPGTTRAFVTASGPDGGYIYTFQALAAAPANTPNGG